MSVKIDMFKVFQAVAEEGSLAAAATRLHRSVSAVSMMLSQFESHLGAALFETERKNRLTPLGKHVLEECRRTNDHFARAVASIERRAKTDAGRVRLAVVPSATVAVLPDMIMQFQTAFPNTQLEIRDMDSAAVRASIAQNEADIGIISALPHGNTPETEPVIFRDDLGIVAHQNGACATAARDRWGQSLWSDLTRERVILNPLTGMIDPELTAHVKQTSVLDVRNTMTLLSFVQAGLGVTVLPRTSHIGASPDVVFLHPTDPPVTRALCKIQSPYTAETPMIRAVWELLTVC